MRVLRLHIVNPNTTASMTQGIAQAARTVAPLDVEITATQPEFGPASIEGFYDGAFAVPGMLVRIAEAERAGADAHLIACFDDTGLDAARSLARAPVIGIGEAAYHAASMIGMRFSVVTTLSRSIPVIEDNLARYGLARRCARVRASDVPVLELEGDRRRSPDRRGDRARPGGRWRRLHRAGLRRDGGDGERLSNQLPGAGGGRRRGRRRVSLSLSRGSACRTSKAGAYAAPGSKAYSGLFAPFAPRG